MRILNWNLRRPTQASFRRNDAFHQQIAALHPDIVILTETNAAIHPGPAYESAATLPLPAGHDGIQYAHGENRASIFSRYPITAVMPTADPYTSVGATIATPYGPLLMYATIIGVFGGKGTRFNEDFDACCSDLSSLQSRGNLCVVGDFNVAFSGYPYPSKAAVLHTRRAFEEAGLRILTAAHEDVPDHIACSEGFLDSVRVETCIIPSPTWLSDHAAVYAHLSAGLDAAKI